MYFLTNKYICVFIFVWQEIPKAHVKCRRNAQSGSWFARDNSANFLKWGKSFGMQDDCLFESEDLGKH